MFAHRGDGRGELGCIIELPGNALGSTKDKSWVKEKGERKRTLMRRMVWRMGFGLFWCGGRSQTVFSRLSKVIFGRSTHSKSSDEQSKGLSVSRKRVEWNVRNSPIPNGSIIVKKQLNSHQIKRSLQDKTHVSVFPSKTQKIDIWCLGGIFHWDFTLSTQRNYALRHWTICLYS